MSTHPKPPQFNTTYNSKYTTERIAFKDLTNLAPEGTLHSKPQNFYSQNKAAVQPTPINQIKNPALNKVIDERNGYTALHFAARAGDFTKISELLAGGADRTVESKYGETPLAIAAANGKLYGSHEIMELLLGNANSAIYTEWQLTRALFNSYEIQDKQGEQILMSHPDTSLFTKRSDGVGLIHLAAYLNRVDILVHLLKTGEEPLNDDQNGFTALSHAAQAQAHEAMSCLIKHGAYLEDTAHHINEDTDHLKDLLAAFKISYGLRDFTGMQILIQKGELDPNSFLKSAFELGDMQLIELLLACGADFEWMDFSEIEVPAAISDFCLEMAGLQINSDDTTAQVDGAVFAAGVFGEA